MDFDLTERQAYFRDRVRDFIDEHVRPRQKDYYSEIASGDRWQPIEVIEELKPEARAGRPVEPVHAARRRAAACRRELRRSRASS